MDVAGGRREMTMIGADIYSLTCVKHRELVGSC